METTTNEVESKREMGSSTEASHETVRYFRRNAPPEVWASYVAWLDENMVRLKNPREGKGRSKRRDGYVGLYRIANEPNVPVRMPVPDMSQGRADEQLKAEEDKVLEGALDAVPPVPETNGAVTPLLVDEDSWWRDAQASQARVAEEEEALEDFILDLLTEREGIRDHQVLIDSHSIRPYTRGGETKALLIGTFDLQVSGNPYKWRCKVNGEHLSKGNPACLRGLTDMKPIVRTAGRGTPNEQFVWAIKATESTLISWDLHDGRKNSLFIYGVWKAGAFTRMQEAAFKRLARSLNIRLV